MVLRPRKQFRDRRLSSLGYEADVNVMILDYEMVYEVKLYLERESVDEEYRLYLYVLVYYSLGVPFH